MARTGKLCISQSRYKWIFNIYFKKRILFEINLANHIFLLAMGRQHDEMGSFRLWRFAKCKTDFGSFVETRYSSV